MKNISFKKVIVSSLLSLGIVGSAFANVDVPVSFNINVGNWDKATNVCEIKRFISYSGMLQVSSIYHEGTDLNENTVSSGKVSDAAYRKIMKNYAEDVRNQVVASYYSNNHDNCFIADGVFQDNPKYKLTMDVHLIMGGDETNAWGEYRVTDAIVNYKISG